MSASKTDVSRAISSEDGEDVASVPYCYLDENEVFQEPLDLYRPGHLHPVIIKDIVRPDSVSSASRHKDAPRGYRILHKLGAGGEATVWLAQELDNLNRAVSLKIYSAQYCSAAEREARVLKTCMASPDTPGSHNIISLLDDFTISGPNGTHKVHVTEVVTPLLSCNIPDSWKREVVRDLARGLAHVHRRGFVHGDIHISNVGCAMPSPFYERDIGVTMRMLFLYDVTMVIPCDPAEDSSSLPAYLLSPCCLSVAYERHGGSKARQAANLYDFGNARRVGEEYSTDDVRWRCPPPEAAFAYYGCSGLDVLPTTAGDVWALGVLIFGLFTGESILNGTTLRCLADQAKLDGTIPPAWREYWDTDASLRDQSDQVTPENADAEWSRRRDRFIQKNPNIEVAEVDLLISLLRWMLKADPDARPTADEVLAHPWFAYGSQSGC
ncbi:kinase-like protein [Polyporus arcularius HHB13444]|uniref:Kinase-like protein n=1 Tax=Polyporus arcularius HHB13444 TaxID=1314778 RepID=A0A5C3NY97_9APHY|nr:kinase-like protein [Polyporus arcularius HHB13444]